MTNFKTVLLLTSVCVLAACSPTTAPDTSVFERTILTATGDTLGTLTLKDLGEGGTEVTVSVSGLDSAGTHAMHFHEFGLCEAPSFTSSGGHKNPMNMAHGKLSADGPHAGDMMNMEVGSDGKGTLTLINELVSINGDHGLPALLDDDGTALIIHEKADDYMTQPTGAAGGRIGCAVL
ncbi:MAG: Cu-Zn family superoxide dismutase [Alphaproteobacteria bacterium]|jgi:Cu-Zn family superoxide dismutase